MTVADQFESLNLTLVKPYRLCVPASKNGEDPTAPDHLDLLLCYKAKSSTKFGTIEAHIDNQFGPDDVTLIHRRELCVPSFNPEATTTTTTTSTSTTTTTLCMPNCSDKTCGDDGCGGSCGDCTTPGQVCGILEGVGQACCFPPGTMNVCTDDNFRSVCCAASASGGVGCVRPGGNLGACTN